MKAVNVVKMALWLALLAGISVAGVKRVFVADVGISASASTKITPEEITLVTKSLRREAVKNLPQGEYEIMTKETVIAQGGSAPNICDSVECVISLGSAIGADFIARGTITMVRTMFALTVEIHETDNGNLVASSELVRAENIVELMEKGAKVCAEMYRTWLGTQIAPDEKTSSVKKVSKVNVGIGTLLLYNFDGGVNLPSGEVVTMPYNGVGIYTYSDIVYVELSVGFGVSNGKLESDPRLNMPYMPDLNRTIFNIGVLAKYPIVVGRLRCFPLLGIEYEAVMNSMLTYPEDEYVVYEKKIPENIIRRPSDLSAFWGKFGIGVDYYYKQSETMYMRLALLYGMRMANNVEVRYNYDVNGIVDHVNGAATIGKGVTFRGGLGFKY